MQAYPVENVDRRLIAHPLLINHHHSRQPTQNTIRLFLVDTCQAIDYLPSSCTYRDQDYLKLQIPDKVFENYNRINDKKIQEIAGQLGLDETELKKQQQNPKITALIRQDYQEGIKLGVRGTPTVFINGKKLRDRSMKGMEAVIEKELQKMAKNTGKEATE